MSDIDDLMAQLPMDQIAARLGVDPAQAEQSTRTVLPALLGGLQANAQDPAGAQSLAGALQQHDPGLLGSGLDRVDENDGRAIVGNIFGQHTDSVASRLGSVGGAGGSGLVQQLLPLLAPYVMAYLARRLSGTGGLGGVLGGALGGAAGGAQQPSGGMGDVLGGVLGQVLGGAGQSAPTSSSASSGAPGGILGNVLGGLLGGGKRA